MSRYVSHIRPRITDGIRVGLPVGGFDWGGYGTLANWCNGHGGMLVPWCHVGEAITTGNSGTFHFRIAPKKPAVMRLWYVNLRGSAPSGVTASVEANGAAGVTVELTNTRLGRGGSFVFVESLGAKTNTVADSNLKVTAAGGTVTVESVACYEQTRASLDDTTDDYGVDINTLRARDPIADFDYQSVAGVIDAYKNLDARRAGYFHWSTDTSSALSIAAGSGAPDAVFDLSVPMAGAIPTLGDTTTSVVCAVYAKVDAGTGSVRFQSDDAGDSATASVTSTTYSWGTPVNLSINCEDFSITDGRRGNTWEGVAIDAWVTATNTLLIQAISIYRGSASNPI
jgi:hypothetical protein